MPRWNAIRNVIVYINKSNAMEMITNSFSVARKSNIGMTKRSSPVFGNCHDRMVVSLNWKKGINFQNF
jgi:hypothetical protein